jgi:hypothetical protein
MEIVSLSEFPFYFYYLGANGPHKLKTKTTWRQVRPNR